MIVIMQQILHYDTNFFNLNHSIIESPYDIGAHIHDCYEFFYFISGDATYYIEGQAYELSPHDLIITNTRELHRIVFHSDAKYERKYILFHPEYIFYYQTDDYQLLKYIEHRKLGHLNVIPADTVLKTGINRLWGKIEDTCLENTPESKILLKTFFIQMLIKINKVFSEYNTSLVNDHKYDPKIVTILNFINNNLDKKITLDILQQKFFMNKYYLSRAFKKNTGFSIIEYVIYKRIIWAMELLISGETALDVAHTVGFGDYSTFFKAFKNITGCSPSQYRNQSGK